MLVAFNLPLPSDNRLAKLILTSEDSKCEKILYLAEHYWHTIVDPQLVEEPLLDVIETEQELFLADKFATPNKIFVFPWVLGVIIQLSTHDLIRVRCGKRQSREAHPESATERGFSDGVAHVLDGGLSW